MNEPKHDPQPDLDGPYDYTGSHGNGILRTAFGSKMN